MAHMLPRQSLTATTEGTVVLSADVLYWSGVADVHLECLNSL